MREYSMTHPGLRMRILNIQTAKTPCNIVTPCSIWFPKIIFKTSFWEIFFMDSTLPRPVTLGISLLEGGNLPYGVFWEDQSRSEAFSTKVIIPIYIIFIKPFERDHHISLKIFNRLIFLPVQTHIFKRVFKSSNEIGEKIFPLNFAH